jgi:hypothetical protein
VIVLAVIVRYPDAFRRANSTARANASLDLLDREVGGGNSVIPDQRVLLEARERIPSDGTFSVAVGERRAGWTDLTAPYAETYLRYYLLPRRIASDARWIVCFACDRASFSDATVVWKGDNGLALLRRPA